jgi:hypothetical protein
MPVYERTKMCAECPFRAKAIKGWLGPLTIDDLEQSVHGVKIGGAFVGDLGEIVCHMEIDRMQDEMNEQGEPIDDDRIAEEGQQCVGMIRYANSLCKRSRVREVRDFQATVKATPDEPTIPPFKLREHHTLPAKKTTRNP